MTGKLRKLALVAGTAIIGLSAQGAMAQSVTMAVAAPVTSLDPHYHQLSPNNAVADTIFDKLINTLLLSEYLQPFSAILAMAVFNSMAFPETVS